MYLETIQSLHRKVLLSKKKCNCHKRNINGTMYANMKQKPTKQIVKQKKKLLKTLLKNVCPNRYSLFLTWCLILMINLFETYNYNIINNKTHNSSFCLLSLFDFQRYTEKSKSWVYFSSDYPFCSLCFHVWSQSSPRSHETLSNYEHSGKKKAAFHFKLTC